MNAGSLRATHTTISTCPSAYSARPGSWTEKRRTRLWVYHPRMDPRVLADQPLREGDWLQHEALKTRGPGWTSIPRRAEIAFLTTSQVALRTEGEPGITLYKNAEIVRWWNLCIPHPPENLITQEVPPFLVRDAEFSAVSKDVDFSAVLCMVRSGWVSYVERSKDMTEVFRIRSLDEFLEHWTFFERRSVWSWLRTPWCHDASPEGT